MSFHTAAALAAHHGVTNLAMLEIDNPDDEAKAEAILAEAMPTSLGEAYTAMVRVAEAKQALLQAEDHCLHCLLAELGYQPDEAMMAQVRRIAMFDVPRRIFAKQHGLWVYWLFEDVFILSPTEAVDMAWAFRRHAFRLQWGLEGSEPGAELSGSAAQAYVHTHMFETMGDGLERIKHELVRMGPMIDVPHEDPIMANYLAWIGSLTGGELLRLEMGWPHRMQTYNCHAAKQPTEDPQGPKPASVVIQMQMQVPENIHC